MEIKTARTLDTPALNRFDIHAIKSTLNRDGIFYSSLIEVNDLTEVGEGLGAIRVDRRSPQPVRDISPQTFAEAKGNTLSSRYGTAPFPLHTDAAHWTEPPKYLLFHCISPGSGNRPTVLQDTYEWRLTQEETESVVREVWKTAQFRPELCTIGEMRAGRCLIRYDRACMSPMTAKAEKVDAFLASKIADTQTRLIEWVPGMTVILDNRRILHARGKAIGPDADRLIKRMLIGSG